MGFLAALNHAINFLAPALWLALWMPLAARLFIRKMTPDHTFARLVALHLIVGSIVLVAGLMVFGHDGKMLTYLALVLAVASNQWWLSRR